MDKYLVKYLRDNAANELSAKYIDIFKIEFDRHIYSFNYNAPVAPKSRRSIVNQKLNSIRQYLSALRTTAETGKDPKILSTITFPMANAVSDLGFVLRSPVWSPVGFENIMGDRKTIDWYRRSSQIVGSGDFKRLLDPNFHHEMEEFQEHLMQFYSQRNVRALFVRSDQYVFSRYGIDLFKKMGRPSFIFTHGLPAIYSLDVDSKSDYLMVWSEQMRSNYIQAGFEPSKIKTVGHPSHKKLPRLRELKSDLSNILVVPVSADCSHQNEYDNIVLMDKGATVLYLYKVQRVLQKMGVKGARFRVHPTVNKHWVYSALDQSFYRHDYDQLQESLDRSSLVLGATTTVMLEALISGVNYIVFEPLDTTGLNMINLRMVPPFDGSDAKLIVANSEDDLEYMLRQNAVTDYSLVHDYIQDFDISMVTDLVDG